MFGKNTVRGQKDFKDAGGQLLVTSLFVTAQGEGPYAGRPAFFVRFAFCQLQCWFCDTFFDAGDWYNIPSLQFAIDNEITKFFKGNVPEWAQAHGHSSGNRRKMVLVITGGEPMLQKNIGPFLDQMQYEFEHTQIESNGILLQEIPKSTTLVVSPKCSESNGKPVGYIRPPERVLQRADCLKFVIEHADTPYASVPEWALQWRDMTNKAIYVSPMNRYLRLPAAAQKLRDERAEHTIEQRSTVDEVISFWEPGLLDMEANQRNHEYAAQYAIRNGLYLSLQMHLMASVA
jgi:7-carboxy-7-deazaguanine synthase